MTIEPIATVKNELKNAEFVKQPEKIISEIVLHKEYAKGLYRIEDQRYIDIVFHFNRAGDYNLITKIFSGETRGVFASRSPYRPNGLGVTTAKLLKLENNILTVSGLDALDGTPVLDIKPSDFAFIKALDIIDDTPKNNPRFDIYKYISRGQTDRLLMMAGQIHGHFCPGLSMGVMASAFAMDYMRRDSDGMEDLLAVIETNNCFSDGVQYVTGCTFGNNALVFKDYGKNAVSLVKRDGNGIRIRGKNEIREHINDSFPLFDELFQEVVIGQNHDPETVARFREVSREASFGMLDIPFDELYINESIKVEVPPYAPIEQSLNCDHCKEAFMASRGQAQNGTIICNACLDIHHPFLDGHGIHCG